MKNIFIVLITLISLNCSTKQKVSGLEKCPKIFKRNFSSIEDGKYKTILKNDTIIFNELRYKCVNSAFYTHKVMYDKFGGWHKVIYPKNSKSPILLWEKIDLFNNGEKLNIYTSGIEEWKHIYASIMVFDKNENDLLASNSSYKEKIKKMFAEMIKKNKTYKKEFYKKFHALKKHSK
ncbi:hypothetical protein [Tenacibaculum sp. nBUS_03]|uniref:hypothetical protein n=1 Tax=Tenacibaculum sp. nBUS_03 TaxID=3395320 RepID=UPI003EB766E9